MCGSPGGRFESPLGEEGSMSSLSMSMSVLLCCAVLCCHSWEPDMISAAAAPRPRPYLANFVGSLHTEVNFVVNSNVSRNFACLYTADGGLQPAAPAPVRGLPGCQGRGPGQEVSGRGAGKPLGRRGAAPGRQGGRATLPPEHLLPHPARRQPYAQESLRQSAGGMHTGADNLT